jgi:hypothetical protein
MPRFLLGSDGAVTQHVEPDEDGFTIQSTFHDTDAILDANQRERSFVPKPRAYTKDGVCYRKVGSIPQALMHKWCMERGGRWPDRDFIMNKLRDPDFSKLLTTEERF